MSSPITFSGFNNIDFNQVLTSLMQQASQPLVTLENHQSALRSQMSAFDALNTRVASLQSAADDLADPASVSTLAGTSSDPSSLGISTGTDAIAGHYEVVVNELARAQVTASSSVSPDATSTVVASGGTLTIGGVAVTLGGDVTLQQLAQAINGTAGIGVTAAVVRTAPGSYRLALTSTQSGQANAFTITNGLTGGSGVAFGDADNNGISGDSAADNAVTATDASLSVNNIPVTGSSNTFEDVIPGVTLTAYKKDPSAIVRVDVAADSSALSAKVTAFVSAYNNVVKFINDQRASAANGDDSSIGREPLLAQLRNSLRTELLGPHGSGALTRLSEAGVEFTRTGTLALNSTRFEEAVANDGAGVQALFADSGGAFPAVGALLDAYSKGTGLIPSMKDRLNQQVASMDSQIQAMQARLALQKEAMQQEFTAADQAMSRLKSQSDSLANLSSQLNFP